MKIKLNLLLTGLVFSAGVYQATAQVANLGITMAGGQCLLCWPVCSNNYILQSTTNLSTPNWAWANDAVAAIVAGDTALSVSNTCPARFFRLLQIPTTTDGMVLIPAGLFMMGNSIGDSDITNANPISVYVSAFYMDMNLVTSNQWAAVYSYATSHGYAFDNVGVGKAANYPVETADWYDVVKWSNARSQQAGLTPVYYSDTGLTQVYTNGNTDAVYPNWTANGYRLPTEAEWEKAARSGLSGQRFPWGDTISESQANYFSDTNEYNYNYDLGPTGYNPAFDGGGFPYTSPVGNFAPNGYGLYDMAGNVWEWCWDWYGTPYGQPTATNPTGSSSGSLRVLRGGDWAVYAYLARCAFRGSSSPNLANNAFGFRCVRGS